MSKEHEIKTDHLGFAINHSELKSKMNLSMYPKDMIHHWSRTGLTANFAAAFFSYIYPENKTITNTLSAILNELVENAVKFSVKEDYSITLNLYSYENKIIFETINYIDEKQYIIFKETIDDLLDDEMDIETRYFNKVIQNVENDQKSGLGLITLLHDYQVKLGVEFKKNGNSFYEVQVQVIINPEEILL